MVMGGLDLRQRLWNGFSELGRTGGVEGFKIWVSSGMNVLDIAVRRTSTRRLYS